MNDPAGMVQLIQSVPAELPLAAYPTAGAPKYQQGRFVYDTAPDRFAQSVPELVARGVRLVGGCCGSTPKHVAAIAAAIENLRAGV
jgi:methionine synthase I (cobalamin-dependent)